MDLDDINKHKTLDGLNMYSHIEKLPGQLEDAWNLGMNLPLARMEGIRQVVIAGMGGSAIGGDLVASYAGLSGTLPIISHRDYELPGWARGKETLVICSSHSGNTEETLTSYARAKEQGCQILTVSTGGKLAEAAQADGIVNWQFVHAGQPRAAVGFSFGLLLAALFRLGGISDPTQEVKNSVAAMRRQQSSLMDEVPVTANPAKRLAGQLVGRFVVIIGSDALATVARRWKGQVSELAKAWAQFEFLPEADHNTLAGSLYPVDALEKLSVIFLRSSSDHTRNRLRSELTRKALMLDGLTTDFFEAPGNSRMEHMWTALHFGDYLAYYLAMCYEVDPTPIKALLEFKDAMKRGGD